VPASVRLDAVVSTLPLLGSRVLSSLDTIAAALEDYAVAATTYDTYAADAFTRLTLGTTEMNPRVTVPRYGGHANVDGLPLSQCNADRLLAAVVLPIMARLGTPDFARKELKLLASAAIAPPTTN